jgi:hypothetical protein
MLHDDQRRLCDWLEVTAGRTRVVSTTRQPHGAFFARPRVVYTIRPFRTA